MRAPIICFRETDEDNSTMCENLCVQFPFARTVGGVVVVDFHGRSAGPGEVAVYGFPKLPTDLEPVSRKFRAAVSAGRLVSGRYGKTSRNDILAG